VTAVRWRAYIGLRKEGRWKRANQRWGLLEKGPDKQGAFKWVMERGLGSDPFSTFLVSDWLFTSVFLPQLYISQPLPSFVSSKCWHKPTKLQGAKTQNTTKMILTDIKNLISHNVQLNSSNFKPIKIV
jgi:hypothetical protein